MAMVTMDLNDDTQGVENVQKCRNEDTSPAATMIPLMVASGFLSGPNLRQIIKLL